MLVLIGPSASGKTEATKILINQYGMEKLVTCTTRPRRVGEIDGQDYFFFAMDEFKKNIEKGYFVETIYYNSHYYGTPYSSIDRNKVVILESQGLKCYKEKLGSTIKVCFLKCSKEIRQERMLARGDDKLTIFKRLLTDDLVFNETILELCDWVIDAGTLSIDEMAARIYENYCGKAKLNEN